MFRKQFVEVITSTGMATAKDLRPLTADKDFNIVSEFGLLNLPLFDEEKFAKVMAAKFKLNFLDLSKAKINQDIISSMTKKNILRFRVIPIQKTPHKVILAAFDPSVVGQLSELQTIVRKEVEVVVTTISCWRNLFENVKESVNELLDQIEEVKANKDEDSENIKAEEIGADVITFVNKLLAEAFISKASDIHIESYEKVFRIRLRVDGTLVEIATPPKSYQLPVLSRLKIMADMDIAERRLPQDGRIKLKIAGKPIDFRVSSLPTLFGEKIVLRLLDQSNLEVDMEKLGFEEKQLTLFDEGIKRPYGMCLVTGPTGSGKTTTLYSAMAELNKPNVNISSAEDPVEFNLEGINQVNVRKDIGLSFASCLKAFLRQDPDIIMVGEIRDVEVGEIAIEAALTGHLVLSTLHTNDAPATIQRLMNMGIEPFLLVAALNVVVAQRLCRRICTGCRVEQPVKVEQLVKLGFAPQTAEKIKVYKGQGCQKCNGTGYKGRVAIHEVLAVTPAVREAILDRASSDKIKEIAMKEGMKTLRMAALTKVAKGLISIEEALNNSAADKKAA